MKNLIAVIFTNLMLLFIGFHSFGQLNGNYTIGDYYSDYKSIGDAVIDLHTEGVSGPVKFNINAGRYYEKIMIGNIPGASAINTIEFIGINSVNGHVWIVDSNNLTSDHYTLYIKNSKFLYFKNIIFQSLKAVKNNPIIILDNCTNIEILDCYITGELNKGISIISNENCSIKITDCDFYNLSTAISITGVFNSPASNIRMENNYFSFITNQAISAIHSSDLSLANNTFINQDYYSVTSFSPIYIEFCYGNLNIERNFAELSNCRYSSFIEIKELKGSSVETVVIDRNYCFFKNSHYSNIISIQELESALSISSLIVNNIGIIDKSCSDCICLKLNNVKSCYVYHNSFRNDGTGSLSTNVALVITGTKNNILNICNNAFIHYGGGATFYSYYSNYCVSLTFDYNVFYTTGNTFAYAGKNFSSFSEFTTETKTNANSISADPYFIKDDVKNILIY